MVDPIMDQVAGVYKGVVDAEMARGKLITEGINSVIHGDDGGGHYPNIAFTSGGYKLLVTKQDLEQAKELL